MFALICSSLLYVCFSTGKKFENTEMFGQYPLQVNGFKDLHECLEAAMIEGEIESLHSAENSARSGQEVSAKGGWQLNQSGNFFFLILMWNVSHANY